eukprot:TRINITY_DN23361_c0_g1_i1.p1 TRINITY_DN23361_c0_g1~~TRINITY_DN23361_c0_g1_i1.p1  ORF type:complete len:485 (-),score=119.58 TRINITY_DN23361_c0_g1_i1:15-1469(-)
MPGRLSASTIALRAALGGLCLGVAGAPLQRRRRSLTTAGQHAATRGHCTACSSTAAAAIDSAATATEGSAKLQDLLEDDGYVPWRSAVPAEAATELLNILWEDYEVKHGARRDDPRSMVTRNGVGKRLYGTPSKRMTSHPSWKLFEARLHEMADEIFAPEVWRCRGKATLFVNCPDLSESGGGARWTLPFGWHIDVPVPSEEAKPNFIYGFAYLDHVEDRGGNTILLTGSMRRSRTMDVPLEKGGKLYMAGLSTESDWFESLFRSEDGDPSGNGRANEEDCAKKFFMEGVESDGVCMRAVELTGAPGDLVLWDPRSIHSASSNATRRPRSVIRFRLEPVGVAASQDGGAPQLDRQLYELTTSLQAERQSQSDAGGLAGGLTAEQRGLLRDAWQRFDAKSGQLKAGASAEAETEFPEVRHPTEVSHLLRILGLRLRVDEFRAMLASVPGYKKRMIPCERFLDVLSSRIQGQREEAEELEDYSVAA